MKALEYAQWVRGRIQEFRQARQKSWQENGYSIEILEWWVGSFEVESLCSFIEAQTQEIERLWRAIARETEAIEQTLGRALGYGCDMRDVGGVQDDVCVGEHVPATLAAEAAHKIASLQEQLAHALSRAELLQAELDRRPKE